jgi:surfeit locus 1 family protein
MTLKLVPTLAYLAFLLILLALGDWQLGRAEEKRQIMALQERQAKGQEIFLTASILDDRDNLRYKKVRIRGHYDVWHQFLLDNQISSGKAGYFVFTPFLLDGGTKAVLVNRGWLPLTAKRAELPSVEFTASQPQNIIARINQFPSVGIKLADAEVPSEGWPSVVQVVDSLVLEKKLGYPLFTFQVELDADADNGYKRDWRTNTLMLPEQHTAYALQWFGLAFTLTLLFIVYSIKKSND